MSKVGLALWRGLLAAIGGGLLACAPTLAAPSDPDPSFGQGGYVTVQANESCLRGCVEFGGSYADALALQRDGGIVVGGYNIYIGARYDAAHRAPGALVRLGPSGELDTVFGGGGGILDVPLSVTDVHTDAIGRLLVSGTTDGGEVATQRYTANGALDTSFGSGGIRLRPAFAAEKLTDRSGRLLGFAQVAVPATWTKPATSRLGVERLRASGQRDRSFGHDGYAILPDAKEAVPLGMIVQRDGGMIAAFTASLALPTNRQHRVAQPLLVRLTSAGKLDRNFGAHGIVRLPFATTAGTTMTLHRGRLLLAAGEGRSGAEDLVLAEYTETGRRQAGFGQGGIARISFPGQNERFWGVFPRAIAFDPAGDAIIVGSHSIRTVDTPAGDGFLTRFTSHGRDCAFGLGGLQIDQHFTKASAVAVQSNGRIVVAGGASRFAIARYIGAGKPRTCMGEGQNAQRGARRSRTAPG